MRRAALVTVACFVFLPGATNFLDERTLSIGGASGVSAVLHVVLQPDGSWLTGQLVPIRLVSPGVPAPDPRGEAIRLVRSLSIADFGDSGMRISREGVLLPPE